MKRLISISIGLKVLEVISYAQDFNDKNSSWILGLFKLFLYIGITFGVIVLAIYSTKYVAKNLDKMTNSRYMKNIDTISLSNKLQINIVLVSNMVYIIASNENSLEVIDKIKKDEFDFNNTFKSEKISEYSKLNLKEIKKRWDREK